MTPRTLPSQRRSGRTRSPSSPSHSAGRGEEPWAPGFEAGSGEGARLVLTVADGHRVRTLEATISRLGDAGAASCVVLVPVANPPVEASGREAPEHHALVARRAGDGVCLIDRRGRVVWMDDAFARLTGFGREEADGRNAASLLLGPETNAETTAALRETVAAGRPARAELVVYRRSGRPFWTEVEITPVRDRAGRSRRLLVHLRDISARRLAERRTGHLAAAVEASLDGIAIIDGFQEFRYVNESFARLHGYDRTEPLVRTSWRALYDAEELSRFDHAILPHLELGDRWRGESVGRRADGTPFPQELSLTRLPGGILVCVVRDVTERKESEDALRRLSLQDGRTGLYNRRGFLLLVQQTLHGASPVPGHTLLLYVDVNDFKPINDSCGHGEGDAALLEVASLLRETFRDSDIIGRFGGDEFVVLATNCMDPSGEVLLRRLDRRLAARNARVGRRYALSLGRGLARWDPARPQSLDELLDEADRSLHENKRRRRGAGRWSGSRPSTLGDGRAPLHRRACPTPGSASASRPRSAGPRRRAP